VTACGQDEAGVTQARSGASWPPGRSRRPAAWRAWFMSIAWWH